MAEKCYPSPEYKVSPITWTVHIGNQTVLCRAGPTIRRPHVNNASCLRRRNIPPRRTGFASELLAPLIGGGLTRRERELDSAAIANETDGEERMCVVGVAIVVSHVSAV
jgi:hypothetical protein